MDLDLTCLWVKGPNSFFNVFGGTCRLALSLSGTLNSISLLFPKPQSPCMTISPIPIWGNILQTTSQKPLVQSPFWLQNRTPYVLFGLVANSEDLKCITSPFGYFYLKTYYPLWRNPSIGPSTHLGDLIRRTQHIYSLVLLLCNSLVSIHWDLTSDFGI